jgi:hypothetical protein
MMRGTPNIRESYLSFDELPGGAKFIDMLYAEMKFKVKATSMMRFKIMMVLLP